MDSSQNIFKIPSRNFNKKNYIAMYINIYPRDIQTITNINYLFNQQQTN